MPLERRNPLPVGRYWIDTMGKDAIDRRNAWLQTNVATVKVVTSESDPGEAGAFTNPVPSLWLLFDVLKPTQWPGPGIPNVATSDVKSQSDTVQRPPVEDPLDALSNAATVTSTLATVATVAGIFILSWLFLKGQR